MELNDRRRKILRAIVEDYVTTAEPVGSSVLLKNHDLGVSSATVRNEMALLEEMGYLDKPHTSAGRIPSYLGYRVYVDELMSQYTLTMSEIDHIKHSLQSQHHELDKLLRTVSNVVAMLTNYTTIVTSSCVSDEVIKNIRLIYVDSNSFVIVLVTGDGFVKNQTIRTKRSVDPDVIEKLSNYLSNRFSGMAVSMITEDVVVAEKEVLPVEESLLNAVFDFLLEVADSFAESDVVVSGANHIFDYPEFNDIKRTKDFMQLIGEDNKELIKEIISEGDDNVSVTISKENPVLAQHDLSAVSLNYKVGNNVRGKLAIVGPSRMKYAKVVSTLRFLAECIEEYVNRSDF